MRFVECDRCGARAALTNENDTWAVIYAGLIYGPSQRVAEVCPNCQTETEQAAVSEVRGLDRPPFLS
jgi:hypothetical protein